MRITDVLLVEHGLLRSMMQALGDWLAQSVPADALRERAALLSHALEYHAGREEQLVVRSLEDKIKRCPQLGRYDGNRA